MSEKRSAKHGNALRLQLTDDPTRIDARAWDALLARQRTPTPFMRHAYLAAMHASGSAVPATGWTPRFVLLWQGPEENAELVAACPLYIKAHSYGEYVFDWAWANAYDEHGLHYYPKALVAVPFTPVPGSRLLARDAAARGALVEALIELCGALKLSSLHVLYGDADDLAACDAAGLMQRQQVQFHWKNVRPPRSPASPGALPPEGAVARLGGGPAAGLMPPRSPASPGALPPEGALAALGRPGDGEKPPHGAASQSESHERFTSFDDFLASLNQEKRKKIRRERRKVADAGIGFRWARGADITPADWAFFYRCYERTYLEHGNAPYLTPAFFQAMARDMAQDWVLFVAEQEGQPIASSLIAASAGVSSAEGRFDSNAAESVAYGRYWGALARVDSLHFEACYYQPLQWCIEHGVARFEGGAQGEHKMSRALMPVATPSAHWLAHPAFADAVERFLARETEGVDRYLAHLHERSPFRQAPAPSAADSGHPAAPHPRPGPGPGPGPGSGAG